MWGNTIPDGDEFIFYGAGYRWLFVWSAFLSTAAMAMSPPFPYSIGAVCPWPPAPAPGACPPKRQRRRPSCVARSVVSLDRRFGPGVWGAPGKCIFHKFPHKTGFSHLQTNAGVEPIRFGIEHGASVCGIGCKRLLCRRCPYPDCAAKSLRQRFQCSTAAPAIRLIIHTSLLIQSLKYWRQTAPGPNHTPVSSRPVMVWYSLTLETGIRGTTATGPDLRRNGSSVARSFRYSLFLYVYCHRLRYAGYPP